MRIFNDELITDGVMTGTTSITSEPIWLGHIACWSLQAHWTRTSGALTGSWKIQVSNAKQKDGIKSPTPVDSAVWSDLSNATGSIVDAASGNFGINLADAGYMWARFVYTNATGTGKITVLVNGKGV